MGRATGHDLHVDMPLSNIAMKYQPENMIADVVAPIVPVPKQSDSYPIWSSADAFRTEDDKRAPGTEANKITRAVSSGTYYAENYALKYPLTLEDRENMDAAYIKELRTGRAKYTTKKLMLNWEKRLVDMVTDSTYVGSYSTVISDWMDYTNGQSDPLGDMWTAINNVQDLTGYKPNRCVMGGIAWRHFRKHADIIDILHGDTGRGQVRYATREQAAAIFEFDSFRVGEAYYNSAGEGQSQSLSQLWLDFVLIYYAPPAPTIEEPSYMYSMRWRRPGLPDMQAEIHPFDRKIKSEEIEVGYYQDEVVTGKNLSFLLTHVTSV